MNESEKPGASRGGERAVRPRLNCIFLANSLSSYAGFSIPESGTCASSFAASGGGPPVAAGGGPPDDEEEDMDAHVWAGVMPLRLKTGALIRDPEVPEDVLPTPHMQSQTGRSF